MSLTYRCQGLVGTNSVGCMWVEDDHELPEGYVWVAGIPGLTGPTRFGQWLVLADGGFDWEVFPDPPFPVVYHEGKLKSGDTLVEIAIEMLPGNIAARLYALENPPEDSPV